MTPDTEARRLAEQHKRLSDFRGPQQDRDLGILARGYIALLERTRLTASERKTVEGIRQFITNHPIAVKQFLTIIDRITQPEAAGSLRPFIRDLREGDDALLAWWPTAEPPATVDAEVEEISAWVYDQLSADHDHESPELKRRKLGRAIEYLDKLLAKLRQPSPAKAATVTEVTREDVREVVYAWMNSDHTHLAAKLTWKPEQTEALIGAFMSLLQQREA